MERKKNIQITQFFFLRLTHEARAPMVKQKLQVARVLLMNVNSAHFSWSSCSVHLALSWEFLQVLQEWRVTDQLHSHSGADTGHDEGQLKAISRPKKPVKGRLRNIFCASTFGLYSRMQVQNTNLCDVPNTSKSTLASSDPEFIIN